MDGRMDAWTDGARNACRMEGCALMHVQGTSSTNYHLCFTPRLTPRLGFCRRSSTGEPGAMFGRPSHKTNHSRYEKNLFCEEWFFFVLDLRIQDEKKPSNGFYLSWMWNPGQKKTSRKKTMFFFVLDLESRTKQNHPERTSRTKKNHAAP